MKDEFETTDLHLAATLICNNHPLVDMYAEGKKGIFVFAPVEDEFFDSYYLKETCVEPIQFMNEVRRLTTMAKKRISK